jgi:NADH-quinone oxidoreductase subunit E
VCPARIPLFQYIRVAYALSVLRDRKSALIPVLLEVQANFGYLPQGIIRSISDFLGLPEGHIRSVASFYRKLRLSPPGRLRFTVCRGTACHIRGAPSMLQELEKMLGIKEGETSPDKEYMLDTVACIGCCAQAPCLMLNNKVYGNLTLEKIKGLLLEKGG